MGEDALIQLSKKFLETDKGKSLLGESINITDITNRIQDLSSQYNIDLSTIAETSIEDINSALGSNLTREQRRERRRQRKLSARERLQERLDAANITEIDVDQKIKAEIALLKEKIKSQLPTLQEFTINGRLKDQNTNDPLKGAKVTLGVNQDFVEENIPINNPLNVDENLVPPIDSINVNDLVYVPIPGQTATTDKQGNFSIKVKIPIIPATQKTPLTFGLLYTKGGYLPNNQAIINGDKTIKTDLSLAGLLNIRESSKKLKKEFVDGIDKAQSTLRNLALTPADAAIYGKRFTINRLVDTIKSKLLPLAIELLIAFGISKISQKNRKTCPPPSELNNVVRTRNRVVRQLNQIFQSILINTALAAAFTALAQVLKGVRLGLDGLAVPQAIGVPPLKDFGGLIFAQPYAFTAQLQNVNDVLEQLQEDNEELNRATLVSLVLVIAGAATVVLILKAIDEMAQECAEDSDLGLEAINQELLNIAEEEAEDGNPIVGNVNGFILSVETDNKNPVGTLKRRFAVAKDTRGITLLKGEPSFSSSDQILIDELVFYIQQNNLKAN
tara:strand:+ start:1260 stop:2936 length:1677 start_codon:yes stop_codon:yes gene_type:complete